MFESLVIQFFLPVQRESKELLISQPALSKAITNLEAELKMDLFFRNGRNISLNENGSFLFNEAERVFSVICDLERGLEERCGEGNGNLSIVTTLPYTFTNIIDLFFNEYPHVPLSKENLQQFIENGKYDVCITTEKIEHSIVEWVPLFEEEIFLTVPKSFKVANAGSIDLMKLEDISFIGLTDQYSFRQFTDQFIYTYDWIIKASIHIPNQDFRGIHFTLSSLLSGHKKG